MVLCPSRSATTQQCWCSDLLDALFSLVGGTILIMHAAMELRRNQDVMKFSRVAPPDALNHSRNLGDGVYCRH